jgi:predicted metalloprotease
LKIKRPMYCRMDGQVSMDTAFFWAAVHRVH